MIYVMLVFASALVFWFAFWRDHQKHHPVALDRMFPLLPREEVRSDGEHVRLLTADEAVKVRHDERKRFTRLAEEAGHRVPKESLDAWYDER